MTAHSPLPELATPADASPWRKRLLLGVAALAALGYVGHGLWFSAHYVETDNAQVDGHIIPVSPKVGGFISAIPVRDNQAVKAGDVLVIMDDRDYRSKLAQADAELAQAVAGTGRGAVAGQAVAQLGATIAQAQAAHAGIAQAEADHERARREAERLQSLLGKKLVSPQQYDTAEAGERSASARLRAARDAARAADQQVSAASAALRGADARLESVRAARDIAAHQLADTRILAASDGLVSQKTAEVGQLVQVGQPLMNLVPRDTWITANLKETQVRDIHPGNAAEVTIDAYPGLAWQGKVESLAPATGSRFTLLPPDNATGNFTRIVQRIAVRVRLEPGQHAERELRPGMNAVVRLDKKK
ncbi:MAG: secretion protein HlyD family protein [Moraxellaceae bacterium]|jgi:membrane fusion protein (multidrug efflux system)|nr:secretion protein HlyD family protein [Moraxellaceae bacterium]